MRYMLTDTEIHLALEIIETTLKHAKVESSQIYYACGRRLNPLEAYSLERLPAALRSTLTDIKRLKEYAVALEATRRDLMGYNEDLRTKCKYLELGQEDLLKELERLDK